MTVVDMVDQEKLRPGVHYTPHGVYVHGLGVGQLCTVEFDGTLCPHMKLTLELVRALGTWFGQPA